MLRRWLPRVLVVLALGWLLWRWSDRGPEPRDGGGPLFTAPVDNVTSIAVRRAEGLTTLRLTDLGWTLEGRGADLVDTTGVWALLRSLELATGGRIMPGAEAGSRRFGFGGPDALDVAVALRGGESWRLALGEQNPVTQEYYASGAGRAGVFSVPAALHDLWIGVPRILRQRQLLPRFDRARVDTVRIVVRGAEEPIVLVFHGRRWWLKEPQGGTAALGSRVRAYHSIYADRREERDGETWLRADLRAVVNLIFEISETPIRDFGPSDPSPDWLDQVGLEPAYRAVELTLSDPPRRHTVELGEIQSETDVWARRDGVVVLARGDALRTVEQPRSHLVDLGALSFRLAVADSFHLDDSAGPVLWGSRAPGGDGAWRVTVPPGHRLQIGRVQAENLLGDFQLTLDRLPQVGVLPPAVEDPLGGEDRTRVTVWYPDGRQPTVVFGRLRGDDRPAVWEPADGKLLLVDEEILVSLRVLRGMLEPE